MRRDRGVALVTVLWLVLLLTLLGTAALTSARRERRQVAADIEEAQDQLALDAAYALAIQRLADRELRKQSFVLPGKLSFIVVGQTIQVDVSDEATRIDLNTVDDAWLDALLGVSGLRRERAEAEVRKLRQWQSPVTSAGAARSVDMAEEARHAPLQRVDEAARVSPVWQRIVRCYASLLTVYNRQSEPLLAGADPGLLKLAKWGLSSDGTPYHWAALEFAAPPAQAASPAGRLVRLTTINPGGSSAGLATDWVVRLTGDLARPGLLVVVEHRLAAQHCAEQAP